MVLEVPAVGREVRLEQGVEVVIVPDVDRRVAERHDRRDERLCFTSMCRYQKKECQEHQAPHLHHRQLNSESLKSGLGDDQVWLNSCDICEPYISVRACINTKAGLKRTSKLVYGVCYESITLWACEQAVMITPDKCPPQNLVCRAKWSFGVLFFQDRAWCSTAACGMMVPLCECGTCSLRFAMSSPRFPALHCMATRIDSPSHLQWRLFIRSIRKCRAS
jgi:hypothetical protein